MRFSPDLVGAGDRFVEVTLKRAGQDRPDQQGELGTVTPDEEERAQTFLGHLGSGPNLSASITKKDGLVITTLGLPLILNFVPGVARPFRYKYLPSLGRIVFRNWRIGGRSDTPVGGDAATFVIGVPSSEGNDKVVDEPGASW